MSYIRQHACRVSHCPNLIKSGERYCSEHKRGEDRLSSTQRGYDRRWRKARDLYIEAHPLCESCLKEGRIVPATEVDHVIPVEGGQSDQSFFKAEGYQSLCHSCHSRKTLEENRRPAAAVK